MLCRSCAKWYAHVSLAFLCVFLFQLRLFCSSVVCFCRVRFSFFSTMPRLPQDWLGRTSLNWPVLRGVGHKTLTQSINLSQLFGVFCFKLLHVLQTFCQLLAMRRIPQLLFSLLYQPFSQQLRIQLVRILQADMILTRWITPVLWDLAHRQQPERILSNDFQKLCTATQTKGRWQNHNRLQIPTWCKTNLVERRRLHST